MNEIRDRLKLILEMRNNILKYEDPLGLTDEFYQLNIEDDPKGEYLLFTGREYVIAGVMSSIVDYLIKAGDKLVKIFTLMKSLSRHTIRLIASRSKLLSRFKEIPVKLAQILRQHNISLRYIPELDLYPGTLLWEYGFKDEFIEHAKKIYNKLSSTKVKGIITLSPHSTEILKIIYPKYLNLDSLQILHYSQILTNYKLNTRRLDATATYHDPCHLVRELEIIEEPRKIIRCIVREYIDHKYSGKRTSCCGAPIEGLIPTLSRELARHRIRELSELPVDYIVVSCPFCLSNLLSAANKLSLIHI